MKPWYFAEQPSQIAAKFKRWFAYTPPATGLLIASSLALAAVWYARFYQAGPAPVVGTTKCPESLCLMVALPPSGRRVPSPPRTLLLVHRSYRLIRRSRLALLSFGYAPRSRSLCRLQPAPTASGTFPTLCCESFLRCLSPYPGGRLSAFAWFFLSIHRPSPSFEWVGFPASFREHDFSRVGLRGCSYFVMFRPPSLLASQIVPTAASFLTGQPRLLHPSETCVVAFARIGHATRLTTGNWRGEDFHLARFAALSAAHE